MTTHDLKIWPEPFAAVLDGRKTYDIRLDDRGFKVGDRLLLREWVSGGSVLLYEVTRDVTRAPIEAPHYTGRSILVEVTHLTLVPAGLCVMAIRPVASIRPPEEIGPHEMVGDFDCERCGEGIRHYLHTGREPIEEAPVIAATAAEEGAADR